MKEILAKSLMFLFVIGAVSCSNEESVTTEEEKMKPELKKITEDYNNRQLRNPAAFFEDQVSFGISDEHFVILVGEAGNYKTSFKIQLEDSNRKDLRSLETGIYKIAYLESDLILSSGDKIVYFAIDGNPNYKNLAANAELYDSYGIAKWHNDQFKSSSSKTLAFKTVDESATCTCISVDKPKESCKSGGEGATSCSQGDCSVTCGDGTYACCNDPI